MGVFDDKKFEELDWISQATEPIDSQLNEILTRFPETLNVDFKFYMEVVSGRSYDTDFRLIDAITFWYKKVLKIDTITSSQRDILADCFELELTTNDVILDFEKKEIYGGEIHVLKIKHTIDEKILENSLGASGIQSIYGLNLHKKDNVSRLSEIMDIIGKCDNAVKTKSPHRKKSLFIIRMNNLFKANEWKIKDTELADKVGYWITDYINMGNLAALSNICRLKVMTHKDQPIYSIEEIV